jgi:phosphoribosylformylglycinamidine (FGAM) synthase PurS component
LGKNREYLKDKIKDPETNTMNKNIRDLYTDVNEFKKGSKLIINVIRSENGNLIADFRNKLMDENINNK